VRVLNEYQRCSRQSVFRSAFVDYLIVLTISFGTLSVIRFDANFRTGSFIKGVL
jgi:hypothetical protein